MAAAVHGFNDFYLTGQPRHNEPSPTRQPNSVCDEKEARPVHNVKLDFTHDHGSQL